MKKLKLVLLLFLVLFLSHCGKFFIAPSGIFEKVENFKVSQDTKPSELIMKFLGENYINEKNNYAITFFDEFCGPSRSQVYYCNILNKVTKDNYNWYAVTIYDSLPSDKWRIRFGYSLDYLRYDFPTFYEVNGLKASLRNLYFNNNITQIDYVPMSFFIVNDTIRFISDGSINSEEEFYKHKNLLDSLSQSQR